MLLETAVAKPSRSARPATAFGQVLHFDALGALGIARTFAYGGHKNRPMYDPNVKLELHQSKEEYLDRFSQEWEGKI